MDFKPYSQEVFGIFNSSGEDVRVAKI